ncbi:MAG: DUF411 domain-containing protein [Candidatus Rokuibacteriota bacterium]
MDHLRQHGFTVKVENMKDLRPVKTKHGVPADLEACHTALVDGYVVEGHVPADLIVRLLRERPKVAGLAVPGMPIGSPGMEVAGPPPARYDVFMFDRNKKQGVFASR